MADKGSNVGSLPGGRVVAAVPHTRLARPARPAPRPEAPAPLSPGAALRRSAPPYVRFDGVPIDVSVLLGTVNRPKLLSRCVEAVRRSLSSSGLTYEIVVAYGTPEEPALPWLCAQPDVVPVCGGMTGAIDAFNCAYDKSRGLFVCQINDDVVVEGDSIARAVAYLMRTPSSAGVVFCFERPDGRGYRHEQLTDGVLHPNQMVVRRATCEAVIARLGAFWGDRTHRSDKTYGGDSAFGVLCHHLGLRLDSVPGVTCKDLEHVDALRAKNRPGEEHGTIWRELFQPLLTSRAKTPEPDPERFVRLCALDPVEEHFPASSPPERERVLHLHLTSPEDPQAGLVRALSSLGAYVQIDWQAAGEGLADAVLSTANYLRPTLVFMQLQTPGAVHPGLISRLRPLLGQRGLIASWCGDVAAKNSPWDVAWQVPLGQAIDLTLHTSFTHVLALRAAGVQGAAYLQIGYDAAQYRPAPAGTLTPDDVCFLGNRYYNPKYLACMREHDAALRDAVIGAMGKAFGTRFALYGSGQTGGRGGMPLARAHEAYWRSKIGLNISLCNSFLAYSSDRIFRILGSGALLLAKRFPLLSTYGLKHGDNCLLWESPQEAVTLAKRYTAPGSETARARMAAAGAKLAATRHTWEARMGELAALLAAMRRRS